MQRVAIRIGKEEEGLKIRFVTRTDNPLLERVGFEHTVGTTYLDAHDDRLYVALPETDGESVKIATARALETAVRSGYNGGSIRLRDLPEGCDVAALSEGALLGTYRFERYKSDRKSSQPWNLMLDPESTAWSTTMLQMVLARSDALCRAVNAARDMVNTPPDDLHPGTMAEAAKMVAMSDERLACKILGDESLKAMGMDAMRSVARASRHDPRLIHLTYTPPEPVGKVVLVGKGVTYDSGGLSLKSPEAMISMKCDKAAGAALIYLMEAMPHLGIRYEVHAIIGAVENMVDGSAYKPDDVVTAMNGTTIEIRSTDAEGRLVLADALCYAQETIDGIDCLVDLATLTGAGIVAFGPHTVAVMGRNEELKAQMGGAAGRSGELVGFLPFNRYFAPRLKSDVADLINSPASKAGAAIFAALFLERFVRPELVERWLHLDMAGPGFVHEAWGYNPKGASGAGVRLLAEFLATLSVPGR